MPEENPNPTPINPASTGADNVAPPVTGTSTTPSVPDAAPETPANTPAQPTSETLTPEPAPAAPIAPKPIDDTPAPMSSPIMKSSIEKPKNKLLPLVVILAILTLAGLGTSIFAFIQNSNKDSEIISLKNQLANQGVVIPDTPNENEDPDEEDPAITPAIRAEILAGVPANLVLSDAKNLNTSYNMLYSIHSYFDTAFSASLDLSANQAILTLNWDRIKEIYNLDTNKTGTENITGLGLSGTPTDLLLTGFGQAVGYEAIFFLMEDGTVEYIPLAKAIRENNIKSYGKLPDVSNVIKFYSGSSCPAEGYTGCGHQSLAQRADGNYYELYGAVDATGNFNL